MTRYACDNCSPGLSLYNSWLFIRWTLWFINPEEVMFTEANNFCVLFRVLVISYRCTVVNYFVPTKTRPTYICTRCSRAIWAFGGWVVYCTTHGIFSACFHLKSVIIISETMKSIQHQEVDSECLWHPLHHLLFHYGII